MNLLSRQTVLDTPNWKNEHTKWGKRIDSGDVFWHGNHISLGNRYPAASSWVRWWRFGTPRGKGTGGRGCHFRGRGRGGYNEEASFQGRGIASNWLLQIACMLPELKTPFYRWQKSTPHSVPGTVLGIACKLLIGFPSADVSCFCFRDFSLGHRYG